MQRLNRNTSQIRLFNIMGLILLIISCNSKNSKLYLPENESPSGMIESIIIKHVGMEDKPIHSVIFSVSSPKKSTIDNHIRIYDQYTPKFYPISCSLNWLKALQDLIDKGFKADSEKERGIYFGAIAIVIVYEKGFETIYINEKNKSIFFLGELIKEMQNHDFQDTDFRPVELFYCSLKEAGWPCELE